MDRNWTKHAMDRKKDTSIIFLITLVSYLNCIAMEQIVFEEESSPDPSIANFIEEMRFSDDSRIFILRSLNNEIDHAQELEEGKKIIFKNLTEVYDPDKKMKEWIAKLKAVEKEFCEDENTFTHYIQEAKTEIAPKNLCKIIAKFKENDEEYIKDLKTLLRITLPQWQNELLILQKQETEHIKTVQPVVMELKTEEQEETITCSPCRRRKNKKTTQLKREMVRSVSGEEVRLFKEKVEKINHRYFKRVGNINCYLALESQFNFYDTGEDSSELPKEKHLENAIRSTIERLLKNQYYIPDMVALSVVGSTMSQM